jgi:hypothetical protein
VGRRSDWSIIRYRSDLPIVSIDCIDWFTVPILYRPIVSLRFKFRFLYRPIVSIGLKFRFLYRPIVSVDWEVRFLYRPIVSVDWEIRFLYRPIVSDGLKFRFLYRPIFLMVQRSDSVSVDRFDFCKLRLYRFDRCIKNRRPQWLLYFINCYHQTSLCFHNFMSKYESNVRLFGIKMTTMKCTIRIWKNIIKKVRGFRARDEKVRWLFRKIQNKFKITRIWLKMSIFRYRFDLPIVSADTIGRF